MSKLSISRLAATAIVVTTLATGSAIAAEPGVVYGAKTVGAMTFETLGRATNGVQVQRQGGFATAGAVQWIKTSDVPLSAIARAF